MTNLLVFAEITPKREYFSQAEAAILSIVEATRAEPGCHNFSLLKGENEESLYLYEEWTDQDALDAHYEQNYTKEVFESYENWLNQPVRITMMNRVV